MDFKSKNEKSKCYLVGGAIRDIHLGREAKDKDYVVTGLTSNDMLSLGFKMVGADFPVFLHPETKEEYALPRIEKKNGVGYNGFLVYTDPSLTIEDDLMRRDLTINAIAFDVESNTLIDPFNGMRDLELKKIRHVSKAFAEDPLRVLRVARFASRYEHLGFTVADETMELMKQMVKSGDLFNLTPRRVIVEFEKCFNDKDSKVSTFLRILHDTGALHVVMPEVDALYGVPQPPEHHPEIDTGIHNEMVADMAHKLSGARFEVVMAAIFHDLGKALTEKDKLPKHIDHEKSGLKPLEDIVKRYGFSEQFHKKCSHAVALHLKSHLAESMSPSGILKLFIETDAFRKTEDFKDYLIVCEADARGRLGLENRPYPQKDILLNLLSEVKKYKPIALIEKGYKGEKLKSLIFSDRIQVIKNTPYFLEKKNKESKPKRSMV